MGSAQAIDAGLGQLSKRFTAIRVELINLLGRFLRHWRQFFVVHLLVSLLVFSVLTPAASSLLHLALKLSGEAVLSDEEILLFALSPAGLVSFLLLGSVFAIIGSFEIAALMSLGRFGTTGADTGSLRVIRHVAGRLPRLFILASRIILRATLLTAPLGLLLYVIYARWLGEYDINFYLATRPPALYVAIALGALVLCGLLTVLFRQFVIWVFALPLILFSEESSASALRISRVSVRGRRLRYIAWLGGWLICTLLSSALVAAVVAMLGNRLVPGAVDSLNLLIVVLGGLSFFAVLLHLLQSWLSVSLLSLLILKLFEERNPAVQAISFSPAGRLSPAWRLATARNLLILALTGFGIASVTVFWLLEGIDMENHTSVIAHRGASASAPENTLAAIQAAIDSGAGWVEIDVQASADGVAVVIHDSDLKKIGGVPLKVSESSFDQLREHDVGSWFDPKFSDQRIPSLAEVLEICKGRIGVYIELKYYGGERRLEQAVAGAVEAAGMQDEIVVMSLSYPGIQRMRHLRPDWKLGLLSSVKLGSIEKLNLDFFAVNARLATRGFVRSAHEQGREVLAWTVNDTLGMNNMISRGVDGIITDHPEVAVRLMRQRAELSSSQRLLMQLGDVFDQPQLYLDQ
jgi:glycerophosphoryl diester phosphodiesterase